MEREEPGLAGAIRKAFLRGACLAVFLVPPFTLGGFFLDRGGLSVLGGALAGLTFGLFLGPSTIVELLAERRPASLRRDFVVAAVTSLLAALALLLACAQYVFTWTMLEEHSVALGLRELESFLDRALPVAPLAWTFTLPFVSTTVGRLHGRTLRSDAAAGAVCGLVAMIPSLVLSASVALTDRWVGVILAGVATANVACVLLLSCAFRLAERVDGALRARLEVER
ncbi:MAG TPA: hypothetical protein VFF73_18960 [Planctomycetota bacterium]|nr:hypothetical protein [Planctomycetota bacterium]